MDWQSSNNYSWTYIYQIEGLRRFENKCLRTKAWLQKFILGGFYQETIQTLFLSKGLSGKKKYTQMPSQMQHMYQRFDLYVHTIIFQDTTKMSSSGRLGSRTTLTSEQRFQRAVQATTWAWISGKYMKIKNVLNH